MERVIQTGWRGCECWYRVGRRCNGEDSFGMWQYGGLSVEEAVTGALRRFGAHDVVEECKDKLPVVTMADVEARVA